MKVEYATVQMVMYSLVELLTILKRSITYNANYDLYYVSLRRLSHLFRNSEVDNPLS